MNILTAFNDGFTMPTKVMLKSLIANNVGLNIYIYILYANLSEESICSIKELEDGERIHIFFIHVEGEFNLLPQSRYPAESFFRLFAHSFLDESVDRILWLDGDLIINGSLKEFYHQDFEDKLYIAVEDMGIESFRIRSNEKHLALAMPLEVKYVNSGVLLLNLAEIRKSINNNDILEYIKGNQDLLIFADQDVLNGLLYQHVKAVDPEHWYNFFSVFILPSQRKQIYQNARIIHYCGEKPWKKSYHYCGFHLWWKYAFLTDGSFQSIYRNISPSYHWAHMRALPRLLLRSYFPRSYKLLRSCWYKLLSLCSPQHSEMP